jgi:hypothetical protein
VAEQRGRRRIAVLAGVIGAAALMTTSAANVSARPQIVLRQPSTTDGSASAAAPAVGSNASVSGDGRYYVAQGLPPRPEAESASAVEPVEGTGSADSRTSTIYLTDRETNSTTELTPVPAGVRPGDSIHPVISGDGCSVVIVTEMPLDVFRDDDTGERWDVYRSRLPLCGGDFGGWELVSTRSDGSTLARDDVSIVDTPAMSRSGSVIAYTHPADRIIDGAGLTTISVVDVTVPIDSPARSQLAAGAPITSPNTTFVHRGLDPPAFSGDGRFLAYRSDAASTDAVPGWGSGLVAGGSVTRQVFAWDRDELDPFLAVRLISARPDGSTATADSSEPVVSRDGRVVAFTSADAGFAPSAVVSCPVECPTQIYRNDRDLDENGRFDEPGRTSMRLLSAESGTEPPVAGTASSSEPTMSADGHLVAFVTKATNLQLVRAAGGGGEPTDGDLLIADASSGELTRLSVSADGVRPAVAAHARPHLSETGRTVVFDTLAAAELIGPGTPGGRTIVARSSTPGLSLAEADLGTTLVGFASDEWYISVINSGSSSFLPATVSVSDRRFTINELESTCALDVPVPPGGDCTVRLSFTPSAPGPVSATLTVAEAGYQATSISTRVRGAGGDPTLRISPAGKDVGPVTVGASATEFFLDVKNISMLPTSISSVTIDGANAGDFVVTTNNCANRPLNSRANCSVGVTFTPTAAGRRTGVVRLSTPAGQYTTMVIAGDGVFAPTLEFQDDPVVAGDDMVLIGHGYAPDTPVTILFGDGGGTPTAGRTTDMGDLLMIVPLAADARGGQRTVVVHGDDGSVASASLTVVPISDDLAGMPGFGLGGS